MHLSTNMMNIVINHRQCDAYWYYRNNRKSDSRIGHKTIGFNTTFQVHYCSFKFLEMTMRSGQCDRFNSSFIVFCEELVLITKTNPLNLRSLQAMPTPFLRYFHWICTISSNFFFFLLQNSSNLLFRSSSFFCSSSIKSLNFLVQW